MDDFVGLGELKTEYGIAANSIAIDQIPVHTQPQQIRDELITMNQHGYMKFEWDEFGTDFANFSKSVTKPVLEIGTAYGWLTHRLLELNINTIAADISKEHLEILLKNAPQDKLDKLHIYHAEFPYKMSFPSNSLGAVLASRVFHFFKGETIEDGLDKIHDWLEVGGKFFCTNISIYHYSIKEKLLSTYKEREKKGEKWPGVITNQKEIAPEHADYIQDYFHVFDIPQLAKLLPNHGFKINKIKLFDYPSDVYSEHNEGHIGFIATKI